MTLFLGIDLGTSGVRCAAIDEAGDLVASASTKMEASEEVDGRPCQNAEIWWEATCRCLSTLRERLADSKRAMSEIDALAVDGTSGTLVLVNDKLEPVTLGYMYHSAGFDREAELIAKHATAQSLACGSGSALARLLFLQKQAGSENAKYALHQADWIAARLMRRGGLSDETNVLKMGYDLQKCAWPEWFAECGVRMELLPHVEPVSESFGVVHEVNASEFGLKPTTRVAAGTTDSNAAFLASGASEIGDGVTSLGTTLAIKLLSESSVTDLSRGIYSHRIKDMWLPGGASNSGGGVLLDFFTVERMIQLESQLNPSQPTGLDYYPLSRTGERFPICDPTLSSRISPRPKSDAEFLQALLEGISEIERIGYEALRDLGAPRVKRVFTAGGGARSEAWATIRSNKMGVPICEANSSDASVGAARIAAGLIG